MIMARKYVQLHVWVLSYCAYLLYTTIFFFKSELSEKNPSKLQVAPPW